MFCSVIEVICLVIEKNCTSIKEQIILITKRFVRLSRETRFASITKQNDYQGNLFGYQGTKPFGYQGNSVIEVTKCLVIEVFCSATKGKNVRLSNLPRKPTFCYWGSTVPGTFIFNRLLTATVQYWILVLPILINGSGKCCNLCQPCIDYIFYK